MDKRFLLFLGCIAASFYFVQSYFGPAKVSTPTTTTLVAATSTPSTALDETLYVLENEYQQLVFSTRGGSLAEINFPFQNKEHRESLVKEIDIDREILSQSPINAHFPLQGYYTADGVFHPKGTLGGYYPLLRRSSLKADGSFRTRVSPAYYALNLVNEGDSAQASYRMTLHTPTSIAFQGSLNGQKVTKTYSFSKGPYCLDLTVQVEGEGNTLWLTSGVPDVELVGGSYSPLLKYQVVRHNGPDIETIDLPKREMVEVHHVIPNWVSNNNGFLGLIVDPLETIGDGFRASRVDGATLPTRLTLIDAAHHLYSADSYPGYQTYLPLNNNSQTTFRIFAGPFDNNLLKTLDLLYEDPVTHYNPEYTAAQSIQGWFSFISQPFSKFLFFLMELFYSITHSWAVSIVLLTIALRAMMYPLNSWSIKSSLKMQQLAPKVKAIREKFKKDPKRGEMEILQLYRESGANPVTGCLPMLLQMPFLIGMFYLLKSSFPLRGAVFIPGWIDDLAAPDVLFSWSQPLWFIGNEFHLLPILMGVTMWLQQKFTTKLPKDPKMLSDTEKQQKMMGILMAILFTVLFYNFPSGLNIYFMFSTLLGVLQQMYVMKKMKQPIAVK